MPGSGFFELLAGARGNGRDVAAFARGELGLSLAPNASVFAFGEGSAGAAGPAWAAGVGLKARW